MDAISQSELIRRVESLEKALEQDRFLRRDLYIAKHEDLVRRTEALEDSMKAAFRMMMAAFLGLIVEGVMIALGKV